MAKKSKEALRVTDLNAGYGRIQVIRRANLFVDEGEVVAVVGRNGAGKTTFMSAVIGMVDSDAGQIILEGTDVTKLTTCERVDAGMAICPSGGRLFKSLTVAENLTIGIKPSASHDLDAVLKLFPELVPLQQRYAGKLSGGERQMVAIGRAMMLRPRLLLMDEPSEGLAPIVVLRLAETIKALRAKGMSILIAEQNVKFTNLICQRWYAIDKGDITPLEHSVDTRDAVVA